MFISRTCLHINANVKIQIYKSQLSKKEGLHYMDMFDRKISQNCFFMSVFLFLLPVVELSQRLNVGKSQPDIMKQKSMDYG